MASLAPATAVDRPTLHLSGERLRIGFDRLARAAEQVGGLERFASAVGLKSEVFQDRLGAGRVETIERAGFEEIGSLMATVRRRIVPAIDALGWPAFRSALMALLDDAHVPGTGDARLVRFERTVAAAMAARHDARESGRAPATRFLRDLAAEVLHGVLPEHYPLMTRWMWDAKVNTGVLRQIWHDPIAGDDIDHLVIDAPDNHATFLVLREELSQFLSKNGIFRDMLWYVDLLCAQIYGDYISAQGGAYLKADFVSEGDPVEHSRRILGLDRIGRRRASAIEADATDIDTLKRLA